jgi:hypothetical protein
MSDIQQVLLQPLQLLLLLLLVGGGITILLLLLLLLQAALQFAYLPLDLHTFKESDLRAAQGAKSAVGTAQHNTPRCMPSQAFGTA